jgi:hypothetical protein
LWIKERGGKYADDVWNLYFITVCSVYTVLSDLEKGLQGIGERKSCSQLERTVHCLGGNSTIVVAADSGINKVGSCSCG